MRIAAITVPIILSAFFTIYKDKNFCLRIIILNFAAMKEFEAALKIGVEPSEAFLREAAAKALGVKPDMVGEARIVKRSVDARQDILYRYRIQAYRKDEPVAEYVPAPFLDVHGASPVIIIGAGPAGMFAALKLLQLGRRPIILERGKDVEGRKRDIARLSVDGVLNPDSNYCYGEGGAGTFSDGKLYTRSSKRGDVGEVLHFLHFFGASDSVLVDTHAHIGTDRLPQIVGNIRRCIEEHGGEYHFSSRVTDIIPGESGIDVIAGDKRYTASQVILACGHSARDIYELFHGKGWALEPKGFAMGVRVEHPQWQINNIRYHGKYQPFMPTAEYSFVHQVDGRGVFSFCMCPGGILVPSSTEDGALVLNGMSNAARNSKWANSGVVVQIEPGDQPASYTGPFALMDFQKDTEEAMSAWVKANSRVGAHPFAAPGQRMKDFCRGILSRDLPKSSYHPGVVSAPLHELLPEHVASRLRKVFPLVERQMRGYYTNDAMLLGVESRTSSAVRLPRNPETLEYVSVPGLYPAGEGAGYAGGIVSSALDGIACALRIGL